MMDATGAGFLAIVGAINARHMTAEVSNAGHSALQDHMALLLANEQHR